MTTFDGYLVVPLKGKATYSFLSFSEAGHRGYIDTTKYRNGTQSYVLFGNGGVKDILIACVAGSATIGVYVWPTANTGKCGLMIIDPDTGSIVGTTDWSSGSGTWESLSVAFTAEAKIYIIRLINNTVRGSDTRAWFDDLAVS